MSVLLVLQIKVIAHVVEFQLRKLEIPPDSEMIVKGMPSCPVIFNEIGLVETNKSFIEKTGLLLARVVVQPKSNVVPLKVVNFSTELVKVYKNTIVGTFESDDLEMFEVSNVSRINCAEIKTEEDIPDHLKCIYEKIIILWFNLDMLSVSR
ncbi:unnamed protein product [Mytilus coruscus]|uniref:Uncharacterized protein n=1 Tax=Mytilus coruscus TaxID=42192 RepID=A0A6J8EBZ8_MYTCO|nr:unnamed protein product [Mytilus coruscus]